MEMTVKSMPCRGQGFCTSESTCAAACSIEQTISWLPPSSFPPRPVQARGQRDQSRCSTQPLADTATPSSAAIAKCQASAPYWGLARVGANHAVKDAGRTERAKPLRCAVPPGIYWAAAVASERACLTFVLRFKWTLA